MFRARPRLISIAALVGLVAGVCAAPARPVWACSCAMPAAPDVAVSQSAAVFSGTVTAIADRGGLNLVDQVRRFLGQPPPAVIGEARQVTFAVADSWKGVTASAVRVGTGAGDADCGFAFDVGRQYLVYAYATTGGLVTNICLRTAELSQATTDLAYLKTLPTLPVTPAPTASPLACLAGATAAALLLALAGAGTLAWRRRAASPR